MVSGQLIIPDVNVVAVRRQNVPE